MPDAVGAAASSLNDAPCYGIGISDPFYAVRDGALWVTTGYWAYRDAEECRQALYDAMDGHRHHSPAVRGQMLETLS